MATDQVRMHLKPENGPDLVKAIRQVIGVNPELKRLANPHRHGRNRHPCQQQTGGEELCSLRSPL
jgi:hypothetical protein